jgi:starvation-inducible DNA-binding protein
MERVMQPRKKSGLTGKARETLANILDHVLRDECLLSATTRDYGWHLTGPHLYSLHRLFEEQRRQLDAWLEKIVAGARAAGFSNASAVRPSATACNEARPPTLGTPAMVLDLRARHEEMASRLRRDIARLTDPRATGLLTGLLEFHETTAWMLRMVQGGPEPERAG